MFKNVIFLKLVPPEAALPRSPTKSGWTFTRHVFPGQIFSGREISRPESFWPGNFPTRFFAPTEEEHTNMFFCWDFRITQLFHYSFFTRVIFSWNKFRWEAPRTVCFEQKLSGATLVLGVGPEKLLQ